MGERLLAVAPELDFAVHVVIAAEGEAADEGIIARLNAVLGEVKSGWQFGG